MFVMSAVKFQSMSFALLVLQIIGTSDAFGVPRISDNTFLISGNFASSARLGSQTSAPSTLSKPSLSLTWKSAMRVRL